MWIMADTGFISIVKHKSLPDTMLVRARIKADLAALFPGHAIETMPGADYLYRATIKTVDVAEVVTNKIMGLDYSSHSKDVAIARSAKAEHGNRGHAMYDTWSAFADLQELAPYSKTARPVFKPYAKTVFSQPALPQAGGNHRSPSGLGSLATLPAKPVARSKVGHYDWSTYQAPGSSRDDELWDSRDDILAADIAADQAELARDEAATRLRLEDEEFDRLDAERALESKNGKAGALKARRQARRAKGKRAQA